MRPISSERFVQILVKHREWGALAKLALRMSQIEQLYRENPGELVRRALAEADRNPRQRNNMGSIHPPKSR